MNYKDKVRQHLQTPYGKEMVRIWGLQYVKKELYHAKKNVGGDNRKTTNL